MIEVRECVKCGDWYFFNENGLIVHCSIRCASEAVEYVLVRDAITKRIDEILKRCDYNDLKAMAEAICVEFKAKYIAVEGFEHAESEEAKIRGLEIAKERILSGENKRCTMEEFEQFEKRMLNTLFDYEYEDEEVENRLRDFAMAMFVVRGKRLEEKMIKEMKNRKWRKELSAFRKLVDVK